MDALRNVSNTLNCDLFSMKEGRNKFLHFFQTFSVQGFSPNLQHYVRKLFQPLRQHVSDSRCNRRRSKFFLTLILHNLLAYKLDVIFSFSPPDKLHRSVHQQTRESEPQNNGSLHGSSTPCNAKKGGRDGKIESPYSYRTAPSFGRSR